MHFSLSVYRAPVFYHLVTVQYKIHIFKRNNLFLDAICNTCRWLFSCIRGKHRCIFIYSTRDIFHAIFRSYLYPRLVVRTLINDGIVILSARRSAKATKGTEGIVGMWRTLLRDTGCARRAPTVPGELCCSTFSPYFSR